MLAKPDVSIGTCLPDITSSSLDPRRSVRELTGLFIFGSNGGGEAFAFDTRDDPTTIARIPFIPMDFTYIEPLGTTFRDFLIALSKEYTGVEQAGSSVNPLLLGKEVHHVYPIVFGGSPTDPKNKIVLMPEGYAEYVVWWNRKYSELKKYQQEPG